jgi:S1-C subfamily serine protease
MNRIRFLPIDTGNSTAVLRVQMPTLHALTRLGLRSSDIIQTINGQPATQSERALEAFSDLASGGRLELELIRGGELVQLNLHS